MLSLIQDKNTFLVLLRFFNPFDPDPVIPIFKMVFFFNGASIFKVDLPVLVGSVYSGSLILDIVLRIRIISLDKNHFFQHDMIFI